MMKNKVLKKGGIDTILAYIVVSIPLFYVLIFMVVTLYHFSIQMHLNQTLKETLILASSYGTLTDGMLDYLCRNISNIDENEWKVKVSVRSLNDSGAFDSSVEHNHYYPDDIYSDAYSVYVLDKSGNNFNHANMQSCIEALSHQSGIKKGDLLAIEITSANESLLGRISRFSIFGGTSVDDSNLRYSAYREEIIANAHPESKE